MMSEDIAERGVYVDIQNAVIPGTQCAHDPIVRETRTLAVKPHAEHVVGICANIWER